MIMNTRIAKFVMSAACVCAAAFMLGSCQSSTPASRIEANPALFQSLPAAHQQLVQQGRICTGMNKDAVMLAWGTPGGSMVGQSEGKNVETWRYTQLVPVYTPHFYPYYGYRWYGSGYYDDWTYIPRTAAEVTFLNGKVSGWQSAGDAR